MPVNLNEEKALQLIKEFFSSEIFEQHRDNALGKNSKLKNYKINPILLKYLVRVLGDNYSPIGVAKALFMPRVLSSSLTTSFGMKIQKMLVKIGLAEGSMLDGMDVEFIDRIDGRKKWCQLKSGPNTINSGDVKPLKQKFSTIANRARTNEIKLNNNDLIVGVLYGNEKQLSHHYQVINKTYPVYVGLEFWHRLTGFPNFYQKLIKELDSLILEINRVDFFTKGYESLASEIEASDLFDF